MIMNGKERHAEAARNNPVRVESSVVHGSGVFATRTLRCGEPIAYFVGYEIDGDTYHSLHLAGKRIQPTGPLRYLNHSCKPNAHFSDRWLIASRDISMGEEITIDYLATELTSMISNHFICKCGAENCRGTL
jgi:uncharacterized protein